MCVRVSMCSCIDGPVRQRQILATSTPAHTLQLVHPIEEVKPDASTSEDNQGSVCFMGEWVEA